MARTKWFYFGDTNIEYGGFYYNLDNVQYNFVDAVEVTPCSDAGGQDNAYWIERITINLPTDEAQKKRVLASCDIEKLEDGKAGLHQLIHACHSYGMYDKDEGEVLQIGKKTGSGGWDTINPDKVVRSNVDLAKYVRRNWVNNPN